MRSEPEVIGQSIGRFRLLERLGEGGMGVVYRARDLELARDVALKVMGPEVVQSAHARARFFTEARAAAAVQHPNIATIFEVGEHQGVVYFVMELIPGASLGARMADSPMGIGEALRITRQIAEALAHAHAAGIVHRDIKPDNVMIDDGGRVKLLDFGIAKSLGPPTARDVDATADERFVTGAGRVVGTPAYMSPEQARGLPVDFKSDLFSVGVVLYEMIAGRLPFDGDSPILLAAAVVSQEPVPLRSLRSDVPREVVAIVDRLLAKDPGARFSSASELVAAIDLAERRRSAEVGGLRTVALDEPLPVPARRASKRAVWAIASIILATGALALWLAGGSDPARERAVSHEPHAAPGRLEERRITANPPELWVVGGIPIEDGRGLVFQDGHGLHRLASIDGDPEPLALPDGVDGVVRAVLADGRMLVGVDTEDPGPLHVVDGARAHRLETSALAAAASPDGRLIAYVSRRDVRVVGIDGGGDRRLAPIGAGEEIEQLSFSPDGSRLALVRVNRRADETSGSLEIVAVDGGVVTRVLEGTRLLQTGGMTAVGWRDDERLLFAQAGDPSGPVRSELWEQTVAGARAVGAPRRLHVFDAAGVTELRWSARGLYFIKLEAQADVQIAALRPDGSIEPPRRLTASDRNERPGAIDADGRVVFVSDRHGSWDLFAQPANGPRATRLTSGPTHDTYPRVAHDGSLVFFRLSVGAGGAIERAHVARRDLDGAESLLFPLSVEASLRAGGRPPPEAARLSCPSSSCVVSTLEGERMVFTRFDPLTAERERMALVLDAPDAYHDWDLTRDEATLALVLGGTDVVLVPTADPASRRVMRVASSGRLLSIAWSPDGRFMLVTGLHVDGDRYVLLRVSLDGTTEVLARSPNAYMAHPSVAPDGSAIVFAQQHYDIDVWRLEGL